MNVKLALITGGAGFIGSHLVDRLNYIHQRAVKKLNASGISVEIFREDMCRMNKSIQVDLVTSFGAMEHVFCYDEIIEYVRRVLRDGGYLLVSMPNLSSWLNRITLPLGYQPRDLEISKQKLYGVLKHFRDHSPAGHVKLVTYKAFKEFLENNGFSIVTAKALYSKESILVNIIDFLLRNPSLGRRFIVLARKI
jgi:SAM-dependent methyltransferase